MGESLTTICVKYVASLVSIPEVRHRLHNSRIAARWEKVDNYSVLPIFTCDLPFITNDEIVRQLSSVRLD